MVNNNDNKYCLVTHKGYHDGILLADLMLRLGIIKYYGYKDIYRFLNSSCHTFIFILSYNCIKNCYELSQTFFFSNAFSWENIHHLSFKCNEGMNPSRIVYFNECVKFRYKLRKGYNVYEFLVLNKNNFYLS